MFLSPIVGDADAVTVTVTAHEGRRSIWNFRCDVIYERIEAIGSAVGRMRGRIMATVITRMVVERSSFPTTVSSGRHDDDVIR